LVLGHRYLRANHRIMITTVAIMMANIYRDPIQGRAKPGAYW
jgi:hypothetical protein